MILKVQLHLKLLPYEFQFSKNILTKYQVNTNDAINYKSILTKNGKLPLVLKELKGLVTDDFLKEVTKNVKEQKQLKKLALEW